MMPEVDGNHFISIVEKNRAVHNIGGEVNIVVQTAVQSMEELLNIVRKNCVMEVIRKPILRERIYTCIERYCPAFRQ
jgi:CheY-like chemotaxis protein